jgi:peptidyl-prolyl cis-trans isomerase SurA
LRSLKFLGLVLALTFLAAPARAQRVDGIAAVVNDEAILQSDVEEQLALFLMNKQLTPDSATVDTLRRQILDVLINEKVIVAEAKRLGLSVGDAEVNRQVEQAVRDAKERFGSEEAFRQQLARENLTEEKLREKYRGDLQREMLAQRVVEKQLPKRTVTASEAELYFKTNKDKFPRMPSEVRVQVIQIPALPDSVAESEARGRAVAVRKRLAAGEKFAKVAAELSEDPSTARSGGDLGFIQQGAADPAVESAVFGLKDGEMSQPVRSTFGWHILQALERDTVKTVSGKDSTDAKGQPVVEVHARHILIRAPIGEADVQRARSLADRVRSEAVRGTNFGTLVRRYSKYQGQQGEDGDLGFVSLGSLQPAIRTGLDTLEVGQTSEVLTNAIGFNIFKVTDRKPEREYRLDEIRDELPARVAEMKQRERYEDWVKKLRAKAQIEIRGS